MSIEAKITLLTASVKGCITLSMASSRPEAASATFGRKEKMGNKSAAERIRFIMVRNSFDLVEDLWADFGRQYSKQTRPSKSGFYSRA
jgi:hypothetical protein